ncbi:nucleoside-diphosphate kinase, partial [Peribacillus sp. SIMBA_075]
KTNPVDAASGTIRGDFATSVGMNIIHGSDSPESAEREIGLWFSAEEVLSFEKTIQRWI